MKKMVFMAAFVAACAAFVACSSNDDLVQQKPDVPEETVEGTPLTIKVTDATRGTDWTASSLPSFSLYTVRINPDDNTKIDRWLGTNENGASKGQFFQGDGNGNFTSGTLDGTTFTPSPVAWENGTWDFYALSNKDAESLFDFAQSGGEDLEDFARANGRNFTYTVPTDYNSQQDLLVGAALGKTNDGNDVEIPFYHALAQIGQIVLTFGKKDESNAEFYFIIKKITLHNIKTTGTYTFPDTWNNTTYKDGTWSPQLDYGSYTIELPQFELDPNSNCYKIFEEVTDPDYISENEPTAWAAGTKRGSTQIPNYFHCPAAEGTWSYTIPIAKKIGSEGTSFDSYVATDATYEEDGGLYIIPQPLAPTVWEEDTNGITGVTSGVYAEIHGIILYMNNPGASGWKNKFNDQFEGETGNFGDGMTNVNNYYVTQVLNHADYIGHYYVPLLKAKKELKAGNRYRLTFDLSKAVSFDNGYEIFNGADVTD